MAATDSTGLRRSDRRVTPGAGHRFVAATEQLENGAPVVSVIGEVDLATAWAFEKTLLGAAEEGTGEVIVDLTGCSFLDSKGLGALIATRGRLERANRRLALVLSNPSVMSIFRITHFDELFEIYPSLPAAVNGTAMSSWRDRESETQARCREENESTARARAGPTMDGGTSPFRCECGDRACTCAIRLTAAEYESVRAYATHFAIARNHENPESEQLVEEHERFAVVEAVSAEAVKLARRSNPRQWKPGGKG